MMISKTLAAAATALTIGALGCDRGTTMHTETSNAATLIDVEHTTPDGWAQSSAALPVGWADAAERRQQEVDFAVGSESGGAPPSAIGGGPSSY